MLRSSFVRQRIAKRGPVARRAPGIAAAICVVVCASGPARATSTEEDLGSCGTNIIPLWTFHVGGEPRSRVVQVGEAVAVDVTVRRPGDYNPMADRRTRVVSVVAGATDRSR